MWLSVDMFVFVGIWNSVVYVEVLAHHRPTQYSRFTAVLNDLSQSIRLVCFLSVCCLFN